MFGNLQMRTKLKTILVLPLLVVMLFAAAQVMVGASGHVRADRIGRAAQLASRLTALVDALQRERISSSGYLAGDERAGRETVLAGRALTDGALQSFRRGLPALDTGGFSGGLRRDLAAATRRLDRLSALRAGVEEGRLAIRQGTREGRPATQQVAQDYDAVIESLLLAIGDAADVTTATAAASSAALRQSILLSLVMLLLVGLAVGFSLLLARSMARPLAALEQAVRQVAERQLPSVVEQLQHDGEPLDLAAIAEETTTALPVGSNDEVGRLAGAFDSVHRVAVRVAAEQAVLRKSIGDLFVNLARRNQSLVDRQLNLIEELERQTEDPDHLDELFRLDHLATRLRRNAENLLVLASVEPEGRWSEPVALADAMRAATSEVDQFTRTRVELLSDEEVRVVGHATSDLVHLLAELIENAVAFSPPEAPVRVSAEATSSGYLVEIEDGGAGMSEEDLAVANDRLASPPEIDFALSRMLGFYVVGRLAARHGIRVQLRHSWYGGVTAMVLIPSALLLPVKAGAGVALTPALPSRRLPR